MASSGRRSVTAAAAISTTLLSAAAILPLLLVRSTEAQQPPSLTHYCDDGAGNYTANSTFSSNLSSLLEALTVNATATGFADGQLGSIPDRVYGLVLCRGDVDSATCRSCLSVGSQDVLEQCPFRKAATIWYDYCLLRYSNERFASTPDTNIRIFLSNTQNVTSEWPRFNQSLESLLGQLTRYAAYNTSAPPPRMFATGLFEFNGQYNNITALVQCTRDLTTDGCNQCLKNIITNLPDCCDRKKGGRVLARSCNFRYEVYSFYNGTSRISLPAIAVSSLENKKIRVGTIVAVVISVGVVLVLLVCLICCIRRKKGAASYRRTSEQETAAQESLLYDLPTIRAATDNFSESRKLGEGGFGVVYKGKLKDEQEIAVKRLSTGSRQGIDELRNEVVLLAKLQHRNLVRLLGLCLEGEEKMLIYEYVHNKSLDTFLFDARKKEQLQWEQRYRIVWGIARALLYLHEESRVKIIHRDLKASNILLDSRMSPKISDFGLARLFGGDQTQARTSRIVGTIGYMSPEYAYRGQISNKSDVFSFGVLVLEIVTGRKNDELFGTEHSTDLLDHAWVHWSDGSVSDIVDPCFGGDYSLAEASKCVEIALQCVQEAPSDRPTMSNVVLMLSSHSVSLHVPRRPAFISGYSGTRSTSEFSEVHVTE